MRISLEENSRKKNDSVVNWADLKNGQKETTLRRSKFTANNAEHCKMIDKLVE